MRQADYDIFSEAKINYIEPMEESGVSYEIYISTKNENSARDDK